MIEVSHLSKRYGATMAVDDVSFTVARGEILGLLGTNGAGKTTIMRILTGYFPPSGGTARIDGLDVTTHGLEARRKVGYLPESVPLYPEMRVRDYLRFVAEINGLERRQAMGAVDGVLEEIGLTHVAHRVIGNLSKGYRQRVGIAQAVVADPPALILDEPTVGLDPAQVVDIRAYLRGLAGRKTVILSTHILPEVAATCSQVVIIHRGRMMAWGDPNNLKSRFQTSCSAEATLSGPLSTRLRQALLETRGVRALVNAGHAGPGRVTVAMKIDPGSTPAIARTIVQAGGDLIELKETGATVEEIFMQSISGRMGE